MRLGKRDRMATWQICKSGKVCGSVGLTGKPRGLNPSGKSGCSSLHFQQLGKANKLWRCLPSRTISSLPRSFSISSSIFIGIIFIAIIGRVCGKVCQSPASVPPPCQPIDQPSHSPSKFLNDNNYNNSYKLLEILLCCTLHCHVIVNPLISLSPTPPTKFLNDNIIIIPKL